MTRLRPKLVLNLSLLVLFLKKCVDVASDRDREHEHERQRENIQSEYSRKSNAIKTRSCLFHWLLFATREQKAPQQQRRLLRRNESSLGVVLTG